MNSGHLTLFIRPTQSQDTTAINTLTQRAFGRDAEGGLIQKLDAMGYTRVSLAAEERGIVGQILFSEIEIIQANQVMKVLSLAPLCVHPDWQKQGIGSALVREGVLRCRALGYPAIFVLGRPEFYRRFGFSAALTASFESPHSGPAFMAAELWSGSLRGEEGKIVYPEPFSSEL